MHPGDLLCILVTPESVCQEGACPRGGIRRGVADLRSSADLGLRFPRSMAFGLPFRTQFGNRPATPDGPSLTFWLLGRLPQTAAASRYPVGRSPRPALKYGASFRKSAEADWDSGLVESPRTQCPGLANALPCGTPELARTRKRAGCSRRIRLSPMAVGRCEPTSVIALTALDSNPRLPCGSRLQPTNGPASSPVGFSRLPPMSPALKYGATPTTDSGWQSASASCEAGNYGNDVFATKGRFAPSAVGRRSGQRTPVSRTTPLELINRSAFTGPGAMVSSPAAGAPNGGGRDG